MMVTGGRVGPKFLNSSILRFPVGAAAAAAAAAHLTLFSLVSFILIYNIIIKYKSFENNN